MSINLLRTLLALAALFTATATPTLLHATQPHAKVVISLQGNAGPGGGGNGGGNDPNPPCDDCAVRAL